METLLIVEDEKMIRQGIKAMVQRSGVPVDTIIDCSNGIDALNLLAERHIDVMLTDIRMQKMDGIELVRRVNEMEDKPLIVAISGYDDFTYAVEMLRNGVKEYLLKPVEREKIAEVLKKLNEELEQMKYEDITEKELGIRHIRELIDNKAMDESMRNIIISKCEPIFFDDEYRICICNSEPDTEQYEGMVLSPDENGCVIILKDKYVNDFIENEMYEKCVGIGGLHKGLIELRDAYKEAISMRKLSFISDKTCIYGKDEWSAVNDNLKEKSRELLSDTERTKRLQIIGTDKTDDAIDKWKKIFKAFKDRQLDADEFSNEIGESISQIPDIYREYITDNDAVMVEKLKTLNDFENLTDYQTCFMEWLLDLSTRLGNRPDDTNIRQKILLAQDYVKENYRSDLNMAVVSNYVSMNYSLFSYSFKQYTGSNFVNYLKEIRIDKAKELLARTDYKILEISRMVGYENEKHFMKTFKAMCGVSPGEYRKNMA
ncbi:response regulator transcription factor [Butyrivibrio sp. LC3010]|uniref:response regulator transcription factor n=1 Tax=Butyrivibrio sp. LC3010 TaxID=1280680 RepID=UPI000406CDF8|nr:response regulator [Butyrivibrio sp. LC3010]